LAVFKKGPGEMFPGIPDIQSDQKEYAQGDALLEEIKAFLSCIEHNTTPLVTGEEGKYALETAEKITTLINKNLQARYAET
jgi:predicted dehydrogenase